MESPSPQSDDREKDDFPTFSDWNLNKTDHHLFFGDRVRDDDVAQTTVPWLACLLVCLAIGWLGWVFRHHIPSKFKNPFRRSEEAEPASGPAPPLATHVAPTHGSAASSSAASAAAVCGVPRCCPSCSLTTVPPPPPSLHQTPRPWPTASTTASQHLTPPPPPPQLVRKSSAAEGVIHWQWVSTGKPPTPQREFRARTQTIVSSKFRGRLVSLRSDRAPSLLSTSASIDSRIFSISGGDTPSYGSLYESMTSEPPSWQSQQSTTGAKMSDRKFKVLLGISD